MGVREWTIATVILFVELVVVDLLYWSRASTFISDSGRFRVLGPALKSDLILLVLAPVIAALSVGWVFSRRPRSKTIVGYLTGVALSAFVFGAAMLLALNAWGS